MAGHYIDPEEYLPLVRQIAARIDVKLPDHWDQEDLFGYGVLGLMDAIEKFQPSRGVKFSTYAAFRIKGAILDALRKEAPVSRNRWELVKKITNLLDELYQETEEELPVKTIASRLKVDEKEVQEALETFKFLSHVSLEQTLKLTDSDELKLEDIIAAPKSDSPEEIILLEEKKKALSKAIAKLNDKQRLVLNLYYFEELTIKEIAEILEVGVSRVSQIKTSALAFLRKKMAGD